MTHELTFKAIFILPGTIILTDSSVNLRAWAMAQNPRDGFIMFTDVIESIKKRFDKEGINIPFPQRTLTYLDQDEKGVSKLIRKSRIQNRRVA